MGENEIIEQKTVEGPVVYEAILSACLEECPECVLLEIIGGGCRAHSLYFVIPEFNDLIKHTSTYIREYDTHNHGGWRDPNPLCEVNNEWFGRILTHIRIVVRNMAVYFGNDAVKELYRSTLNSIAWCYGGSYKATQEYREVYEKWKGETVI